MALRVCAVLAVTAVLAVAPAPGRQKDGRVPAAAVEAWQRRHDRVSTLKATFTEDVTIHRGYFLRLADGRDGPDVPDKDVSTKLDCVLLLTENKFKYSYKGSMWSSKTRTMEPTDHTSISTPGERIFGRNLSNPEQGATYSTSNERAISNEVALTLVS